MKNKKLIFSIIGILLIVILICVFIFSKTQDTTINTEDPIVVEKESTGEVEVVETIVEVIHDDEEVVETGLYTYVESPDKDKYKYYDYIQHNFYEVGYVQFEDLDSINEIDTENNIFYTENSGISIKTMYVEKTEDLDLENVIMQYTEDKTKKLKEEPIVAWCTFGSEVFVGNSFAFSEIVYWTEETNFPKRHIYYYENYGEYYQIIEINIDYSKNAKEEIELIIEELDKILYLPQITEEYYDMYLDY